MKQFFTLSAVVIALGGLNAQNTIEITDLQGNVVNGTEVVHYDLPSANPMEVDLHVENLASADREINVKRYELNVRPNTRNYFCWGVCYTPQWAGDSVFWESVHPIFMEVDSVYQNFHAYHMPMSDVGISSFRYVWFDTSDPNDSTWVDITFDTQNVSIAERSDVQRFSVFPNPAVGGDVAVSFDVRGDANGLALVVHDALGQPVLERPLTMANGRVQMDVRTLSPGVYFATLQRKGVLLSTRRVVVGQ